MRCSGLGSREQQENISKLLLSMYIRGINFQANADGVYYDRIESSVLGELVCSDGCMKNSLDDSLHTQDNL